MYSVLSCTALFRNTILLTLGESCYFFMCSWNKLDPFSRGKSNQFQFCHHKWPIELMLCVKTWPQSSGGKTGRLFLWDSPTVQSDLTGCAGCTSESLSPRNYFRNTKIHTFSSSSETLSSPLSRRAWSRFSSSRSFSRRVSAFRTACTAGVSSATTSNKHRHSSASAWDHIIGRKMPLKLTYPVHTGEHRCWGGCSGLCWLCVSVRLSFLCCKNNQQ